MLSYMGVLKKLSENKFLGKYPSDTQIQWHEWQIQAYCVQEGRRMGYLVVGNTEQGKRTKASGGRLKACGMVSGNPDMAWFLNDGKLIWIELKTKTGILSKSQLEHHAEMSKRGHIVHVVYAESPTNAWNQIKNIIDRTKR